MDSPRFALDACPYNLRAFTRFFYGKLRAHITATSGRPPPACHLERSNRVAIAQSKPKAQAPQGDRRAIGSTRSTLFAQILHEREKNRVFNTSSVGTVSYALMKGNS